MFSALSSQCQSGLIAHWDMNGSANDISGNGNNGTGNNVTPAVGEDGIMGHAYYFNGNNSSISVPYSSNFNVSNFTIAANVKVMGYYSGICQANTIFTRGGDTHAVGSYCLAFDDNHIDSNCSNFDSTKDVFFCSAYNLVPSSYYASVYSPSISDNIWYNIVATFNDTVYKLYINNVLVNTSSCATPGLPIGTSSNGIAIGYDLFGTASYPYPFNGIIDDIKLFNRVLSDTEIVHLNDSTGISSLDAVSFWDNGHNCTYDSAADPRVTIPVTFEIDSNNVPVDTICATSGFYYSPNGGNVGDIYAFKAIATPPGITLTCPASGIIYDTISSTTNNYPIRYLGFVCSTDNNFDLSVTPDLLTGRHLANGCLIVNNPYCDSVDATLTMNFSPKYIFSDAVPAPASVSGNTITWSLPKLSSFTPLVVNVHLSVPGAWLTAGDTINSSYLITPTTGDVNPGNNYATIIDTVRGSYDPNEMSVTPSGYITAGTSLTYTVRFENTGNDTAFNIIVVDTLSDNVDVNSLSINASSAGMNTGIKGAGHNIVSFNFPNINLLDSSHHGSCDGMVVFTVKSLNGLPLGSTIFNRAGIYFDNNPVVMTNTVEDIIGYPAKVSALNTNKFKLFPNPAQKDITISSPENIGNVEISNLVGQPVYNGSFNDQLIHIDVSGLPPGLYLVRINGSKMQKFTKE